LDGTLSDEFLQKIIDHNYDLVLAKLPLRTRALLTRSEVEGKSQQSVDS